MPTSLVLNRRAPACSEWQYYIKGTGRMTVFGSHGRARTDDFGAGDVGYVPQGYGHLSRTPAAAISRSWRCSITAATSRSRSPAGNPDLLLSTNFGVKESVFAKFPKDAVIIPEQGG